MNNTEKCEYVVAIEWFEGKTVKRENAYWKTQNPKLYATTHIRASLKKQEATIEFLKKSFNVKFIF